MVDGAVSSDLFSVTGQYRRHLMSSQITTAFVEQYKSNVLDLVQQKGSRFRNAVMVDANVNGKKKFTEQVGTTNAQLRTSRHADSP